jgi:hypothetical protein
MAILLPLNLPGTRECMVCGQEDIRALNADDKPFEISMQG